MKYKIILKTSSVNADRVDLCLKTWLKDLDYVCLTDIPTGRFNEISGSKRTDYYSAEEKTVHLINLVKDTDQFDEYDWLVFIDDDAILNTKMFNHIVPHLSKNAVYGLKMHGSYPKAPTLVYPSGGSGYFISPSLIKKTNHMIDNGWGVEDASVGEWIRQNRLHFEDHYFIDGKRYYLKLNGWFPFGDERKYLNDFEIINHELYPKRLLECIPNHHVKCESLLTCMTHHYIRWEPLMEYIFDCFKKWEEIDLEANRSY